MIEIRKKESEPMTLSRYIMITKKNKLKEVKISNNWGHLGDSLG